MCIWAGGIGINTAILYYCSPTPLRTSARWYLQLAAIATAGLSTTIYTVLESAWFAACRAASSALAF